MKKPVTYAKGKLDQLGLELAALFVLTTIAVAHLFEMHWVMAAGLSPLVMVAMLAVVSLLVEILWLMVVGVDKIGHAVGLRKSPLA